MEKKKEKITMFNMITQVIQDNLLSSSEEDLLINILQKRAAVRETERKNRCILGILEQELALKLKNGELKPTTIQRYKPIIHRCFSGTYGNMDASELTEEILHDFITEIYESDVGLNRNEMYMFMSLLKKALEKMNEILNFTPSQNLFINHTEMTIGTRLIKCPFSFDEKKVLFQWVAEHSSDIRGLACGLWLIGGDGLSPDKIMELKSQEAWKYCIDGLNGGNEITDIIDFNANIDIAAVRGKIIQKALSLHPEDTSYVFMIPKKESDGWKKLSGSALQVKMNWICTDLGIRYKSFHNNEAITYY